MATLKLSMPFVLGLLAEAEHEAPKLHGQLLDGQQRAAAVEVELAKIMGRLDTARDELQRLSAKASEATATVAAHNARLASLHQEIATFQRRADELKAEMEALGRGPAFRQLRRERARARVEIQERQAEISKLQRETQQARTTLQEQESQAQSVRDRERLIVRELDGMQDQLPSPYLYVRLFEASAARAHCRLFLDQAVPPWARDIAEAAHLMLQLHEALRAGRYRLDKFSEVLGGRAAATAEAVCGAVSLGDRDLAARIFSLATDPGLFFDEIFSVFRLWCVGLYVTGQRTELQILLRRHRYSEGVRGAYVQAFAGLLAQDPRRVDKGLKDMARYEWELWQEPQQQRGVGVVNLAGVAIARLAMEQGVAVRAHAPTLPRVLLRNLRDHRAKG